MFFDSHCHFDFAAFDSDRDAVWQACQSLGVRRLLIPGVNPAQWSTAAQLCESHEGMYQAVGLHPWWDGEFVDASQLYDQLCEASRYPKCLAIGECGLDAFTEMPMARQQDILAVHLRVASELRLPIIIHCRKGHNELMSLLKQQPLPAGGVIHAFSGSYELAEQYWAMGFYLGIGGTITYERANKTRTTVKRLPLAALLLESDAPDMPLQGQQGQRNSPQNIPRIAETLAGLRGETVQQIAQQTTANARLLFNVPDDLTRISR